MNNEILLTSGLRSGYYFSMNETCLRQGPGESEIQMLVSFLIIVFTAQAYVFKDGW